MPEAFQQVLDQAGRTPLVRPAVYTYEALRLFLSARAHARAADMLADYQQWRCDRQRLDQPLVNGVPWLTYGAIHHLEAHLNKTMKVFEYGAGASTLFFASRAAHVDSIEHDEKWGRVVRDAVAERHLKNVVVQHIPAEVDAAASTANPADADSYRSSDTAFATRIFRAYASSIDRFPDETFHVILVDGRARPSCVKHAAPKLVSAGLLILDNADRRHYRPAQEHLAGLGWSRREFVGSVPYSRQLSMTTIWQRPGNA